MKQLFFLLLFFMCVNAIFIQQNLTQNERLIQLNKVAISRMKSITITKLIKTIQQNE
jgi:hypothetical protein